MSAADLGARPRGFADRLERLDWGLITLISVVALIGAIMQNSVSDSGAMRETLVHAGRFLGLLVFAVGLATLDLRLWMGIAYPLYAVALALILAVEIPGLGHTAGGATLWLRLGPVQFQPSELMKVAIVLALARYYQRLEPRLLAATRAPPAFALHRLIWRETVKTIVGLRVLIVPAVLIGLPVALVARQPDLGTATLIALAGASVMVLAGLRKRYMAIAFAAVTIGAVAAYHYVLEPYQRSRIEVFLGLSEDRLGTGYNIAQAKIAVGAAGWVGHGYGQGPQSQGNFVPEKHTDFIFPMIVEEFGMLGGWTVLLLFGVVLAVCMTIAIRARSLFAKLAAGGVTATLGAYVLINTAMVLGLFPVVGIPLPLISYGGTSMLTTMIGLAIVLAVDLHKKQTGSRGLLY